MSHHSQPHYYIETDGRKDGPHDLITIMRRIRAKKINRDTRIYIGIAAEPVSAGDIGDIALFFTHEHQDMPGSKVRGTPTLSAALASGWQFTLEHNAMTVYAGGLLLMTLMLAVGLINALGSITGGMIAWCVFLPFHHLYLIFVLRLYRRQPLGSEFINQQLAPVLKRVIVSSILLALMMAGGTLLFIIPGIIVATLYIFVPFLLLDHRYTIIEAMEASRLLIAKCGAFGFIALLLTLHLLCLALIIPLPLTLPLFAAVLSEFYEEISAL